MILSGAGGLSARVPCGCSVQQLRDTAPGALAQAAHLVIFAPAVSAFCRLSVKALRGAQPFVMQPGRGPSWLNSWRTSLTTPWRTSGRRLEVRTRNRRIRIAWSTTCARLGCQNRSAQIWDANTHCPRTRFYRFKELYKKGVARRHSWRRRGGGRTLATVRSAPA